MGDYLRTFLRFDPPAIRRAVLRNFAAALTEGAGLLMLLPPLSLAGVLEQGEYFGIGGVGTRAGELLEQLMTVERICAVMRPCNSRNALKITC